MWLPRDSLSSSIASLRAKEASQGSLSRSSTSSEDSANRLPASHNAHSVRVSTGPPPSREKAPISGGTVGESSLPPDDSSLTSPQSPGECTPESARAKPPSPSGKNLTPLTNPPIAEKGAPSRENNRYLPAQPEEDGGVSSYSACTPSVVSSPTPPQCRKSADP